MDLDSGGPPTVPPPWRRFAALGDSFTEGLMDVLDEDGRHVGWADRVANELARRAVAGGADGIDYANLAVRGRLVGQVVAEQVPAAVALRPDLASLAVGVNDCIRPRFDLDAVAGHLEAGVRDLRSSGADVLVFSFGDPSRRSWLMGRVRDRIRAYNTAVDAVARRYRCRQVSFWQVAALDDDRFWDADRLHLSPAGHALAAQCALSALGLSDQSWRTPVLPSPRASLAARGAGHLRWTSGHLAPWLVRRLRGESSGDAVWPKHVEWTHLPAVAGPEGTT